VNPRVVTALVLAAALASGAVIAAAGGGEQDTVPAGPFEGAVIPAGVRAPDFTLRDQDGEKVSLRSFRGSPVVVAFMYATCEDSCPPQAQQVKGALDDLGRDVPVLAVSVDPRGDTPRAARRFLLEQRMTGRMRFLLGERGDLAPVWRGFAVQPQSRDTEHQARTVLVDRDGFQRVGFPLSQTTPERLEHDLRILLAE